MHFVTGKKLPRRAFLRTAGATVALPLLDAMVTAYGATKGTERTRLICIEEVHGLPGCNEWGATQHLFAPATVGRGYELATDNVLKSLEPWRDRFTIISNTDVRMADMNKDLGASDRRRVDRYLESVREIERRIQKVEAQNNSGKVRELPDAPPGVPDSYSEHMKLMFDVQVLAFQTDITRVVSFKTGRDASNRTLPESGSDQAFHPSSHHRDNKKRIMEVQQDLPVSVQPAGLLPETIGRNDRRRGQPVGSVHDPLGLSDG